MPSISANASSAQPTVGQNGVARMPKCQGRGLRVKEANSTAAPHEQAVLDEQQREQRHAAEASESPQVRITGSSGHPRRRSPRTSRSRAAGPYQGGHGGPGRLGQLGRIWRGASPWGAASPQRSTATKSSARSRERAEREVASGDRGREAVVEGLRDPERGVHVVPARPQGQLVRPQHARVEEPEQFDVGEDALAERSELLGAVLPQVPGVVRLSAPRAAPA